MMMETNPTEQPPAIPAEDISAVAERIDREPELPGKAGRVLEAVTEWASPSLVAGLRRDKTTPSGWLAVPELTSGALPPGFGASFTRLLEGIPPASLEKPKLIRPAQAFGGVKVKPRDSWLLPWSAGRESGFLVVRGIPRPYAANLPDAIARLCEPIWPLVAAGLENQPPAPEAETTATAASRPGQATELEQAAEEAERLARRLSAVARREQERAATDADAAALRSRLEALEAEAGQLRERLAERESQDEDGGKLEQVLADRERELEEARSSVASLQQQVDTLQGTERKAAEQLEQAQSAQKRAELALACKEAEQEEGGQHLAVLQKRVETLETEKAASQSELEVATKHLAALRSRMEALEKTGRADQDSLREKEEEVEALRARTAETDARLATVESERDEARASRGAEGSEEADETREAVVSALAALRRTPFVPPMLRVAFSSVEEQFDAAPRTAEGAPPPMRVLLLDRNITRLDSIAAQLEEKGIEPLLAHYTEEVSFFLKTPEGSGTAAVVCDVMAFRPEQDLLDLFRLWRRDVPALTIVLSHEADNPLEQERVSQVPPRTAGHVAMPLSPEAILEAIVKAQFERPATPDRPRTGTWSSVT